MTPQMQTALRGRRALILGLARIELPDHTIRLADGSIAVTWAAETFTGKDNVYGSIHSVEDISETTGDSVPGLVITLLPPTIEAAVALCQPANQGAQVRVWLATVDYETGEVIPEPDLQFAGEIDTADPVFDVGSQKVEIGIGSVWDRLLEPDEGARLSDSFHQSIFPGELGFSRMSDTTVTKMWGPGSRPPAATSVPAVSRGGANRYF